MRPIRLELEGFTSFRQRTVLDFSELDLFAITGPTGAGKTSLIDGMLYALYGRTSRITQNNAAHLLSQGAPRLTAYLEFSSAGRVYKVARTFRRGGTVDIRLEAADGAGWTSLASKSTEVREKIIDIIGLDFDAFTKAVVLPQGEFDRFLRGEAKVRREILSNLLNLKIYSEMGKLAGEKMKAAVAHKSILEADLLSQYHDATEENRASLGRQITQLKDDEQLLSTVLRRVNETMPLVIKLRDQRSQMELASRELESARTLADQAGRSLAELDAKAATAKLRISDLDKAVANSSYDEALLLQLSALKPVAEQRDVLRVTLGATEMELAQLTRDTASLEPRVTASARGWEQATLTLQAAEARVVEKEEEQRASRERYGSPDAILAVAKDCQRLGEQIKAHTQLEHTIAILLQERLTAEQQIAVLEVQEQAAQIAVDRASEQLEHLRRDHAAGELRAKLVVDEPCPVCDRIVKKMPAKMGTSDVTAAHSAMAAAGEAKRELYGDLLRRRGELVALPKQIAAHEGNKAAVGELIMAVERKATAILGLGAGSNPAKELTKLAEKLSLLAAEVGSSQRDLREASEIESRARHTATEKKHELAVKKTATIRSKERIEEDSGKLYLLNDQLGPWKTDDIVKSMSLQNEAKQTRTVLEKQRKQESELIALLISRQAEGREKAAVAGDRLANLTTTVDFGGRQIAIMERDLAGRMDELPIDDPDELEAYQSELDSARTKAHLDIAVQQSKLEALISAIAVAESKRGEAKFLGDRAALLKELHQALRADQFLTFILEESLQRLSADATGRLLQMSSGRYSFAAEDDDFYVLDHWNADAKRPVNTLSGGESFFASLSLAMALAGSIGQFAAERERISLETLFLDEGFSTLDAETLETVIASIETLAGEDRLVGVVSHVAELAERLPARILVTKAIGGSTITLEGANVGAAAGYTG